MSYIKISQPLLKHTHLLTSLSPLYLEKEFDFRRGSYALF